MVSFVCIGGFVALVDLRWRTEFPQPVRHSPHRRVLTMEPNTTYKSALTMDQPKLTKHKSAVEITHHHDVPAATDSLEIMSHDEDETVTAAADSLEIVSHDGTVTAPADSLEMVSHDGTVTAPADSLEIVSYDGTVTAPADSLEIISHGTTTANYWPIEQIYSQGENFSL